MPVSPPPYTLTPPRRRLRSSSLLATPPNHGDATLPPLFSRCFVGKLKHDFLDPLPVEYLEELVGAGDVANQPIDGGQLTLISSHSFLGLSLLTVPLSALIGHLERNLRSDIV